MQEKELTKNIVCSVFTFAFATWIMICAASMRSFTNNRLSPAFIPRCIAVVLYLLGVIVFVNGLLGYFKAKKDSVPDTCKGETIEADKKKKSFDETIEMLIPYITMIFIFLYLVLMKRIGFTISSVLFLTAQITLLSGNYNLKSLIKYFVIAVIASVIIWLVFYKALALGLPVNNFGF